MYIAKELWNAVDWAAKGFTVGTDRLLDRHGNPIVYFYMWNEEKIEFYFDWDNLNPTLSQYERDYANVIGREYEWYWGNKHISQDIAFNHWFKITPEIWEEFSQVKASAQARKSWMYKRIGQRGLLKRIHDGTLYPRYLVREISLDEKTTYVKATEDLSSFFVWNGQYFSANTTGYLVNGEMVPLPIIIQHGDICEEHGVFIGRGCPICAARYKIHGYSTRAEHILPFKDEGETTPQYMGIELEYEDCLSQLSGVYKALDGHVIVKHDGSINNGFEIVTAPATIGVHKKAFAGFYSKFKGSSLSNCGMHVHVDKRKLNQMQLGKILAFVYSKENIPHLEKLAGRSFSTNRYCLADKEKKVTTGITGQNNFTNPIYRNSDGKYSAVNTSPQDTIEFRIFAPPTDETTLFSRLEFVQALMDWTKPAVCSVKDAVSWEKFLDFVGFYKKSYPNLVDTLFGKKLQANVWVDEYSLAA